MLVGLASAGGYGVALLGQDVDGHAAHPTGGAGDQHRAVVRPRAIAFHGEETHSRSEASRAQGHGFKGRERCWDLDDPCGWYADIFGVAAKGPNPQVIASDEDTVTHSEDRKST